MSPTRCDLHLHSSASRNQDEWFGRYFDCPESYADPLAQYDLCKARGMTLVTLTDHDTIAGGLGLINRRDFFLSEEITARFPENGCVMHVLAWNITPDQHGIIQERRDDIYKLTDYLRDNRIAHGLAHPLLSPNWKLDRDTFEKALLLFPTFESVNGLHDARTAPDLADILSSLDQNVMQRLATKHGRAAIGDRPHLKAETGGSDDHVCRRSGTIYTEVASENLTPAAFLDRVLAAEARVVGQSSDLNAMSACAQKTTSDFLRRRDDALRPLIGGDPVSDLMESVAGRRPTGLECAFLGSVVASGIAPPDATTNGTANGTTNGTTPFPREPLALSAADLDLQDSRMVEALGATFDINCARMFDAIAAALGSLDLYRIIDAARDLVCSTAAVAPYLFSVNHFGKQFAQAGAVRRQWNASPLPPERRRLAVFSDGLDQVDRVAGLFDRFASESGDDACDVLIPYCGDITRHPDGHRLHALTAVRTYDLPFAPGARSYVPSLIGTIDWLWRQRVSSVELSSPGPMGLVGLVAAKLLRLPVTASTNAAVPALVAALGADPTFAAASKKYVAWFYNRAGATSAVQPERPTMQS